MKQKVKSPEKKNRKEEEGKSKNIYKGLFYNDTSEKEYYEHGAHFSYKELYTKLFKLKAIQAKKAQKEMIKNINTKSIKMKITRNCNPNMTTNKNLSTINVINNNNINLTNLNVNVNLNFNNDSGSNSLILEKLNQIEKTMLNNVKMSSIISRNNFQSSNCNIHNYNDLDYNSYFYNKDKHRNLTLYNAIKRINHNKSKNSYKKCYLVNSVRNISKEKKEHVCNESKKRATSSLLSKKSNLNNMFKKKLLFLD